MFISAEGEDNYFSVCVHFTRTPGNKPGSSTRGQTAEEAGRRQGQSNEANSSVSDLANSVTSEMLMVIQLIASLASLEV